MPRDGNRFNTVWLNEGNADFIPSIPTGLAPRDSNSPQPVIDFSGNDINRFNRMKTDVTFDKETGELRFEYFANQVDASHNKTIQWFRKTQGNDAVKSVVIWMGYDAVRGCVLAGNYIDGQSDLLAANGFKRQVHREDKPNMFCFQQTPARLWNDERPKRTPEWSDEAIDKRVKELKEGKR
jgi:hypothetical protein